MPTNLFLEGEDVWGQQRSRAIYNDNGRLCVKVRKKGSLRQMLVPYREFAAHTMCFHYLIERNARQIA